jgi:hypothetical protein
VVAVQADYQTPLVQVEQTVSWLDLLLQLEAVGVEHTFLPTHHLPEALVAERVLVKLSLN